MYQDVNMFTERIILSSNLFIVLFYRLVFVSIGKFTLKNKYGDILLDSDMLFLCAI